MRINDGPYSDVAVPHVFGAASRTYVMKIYFGKRKAYVTFVVLANSSRDARARLKSNTEAAIKKLEQTHWPRCYRSMDERKCQLRGILAGIKNNKIKIIELESNRVYPIAKFDEVIA